MPNAPVQDQTAEAADAHARPAILVAAGVAFGLVFWYWGLPYSIACHCMANATHLLLMPAFF